MTQLSTSTTEANNQSTWQTPGTASGLYLRLGSNGISATSTLRTRINGSNGSQVISITASTSGEFQDLTNSDSISATNKLSAQMINGGTGTTITSDTISFLFSANTSTATRMINSGSSAQTLNNSTRFVAMAGGLAFGTTEANLQYKIKTAATMKNLMVNVSSNSKTTCTAGSRKNTGAGALTISITASTTGFFENISNSDSIVVNDLYNYSFLFGADANSITVVGMASDMITTNNTSHMLVSKNGQTLNVNTSSVIALTGAAGVVAAESDAQAKALTNLTASNLAVFLNANTVTGASTCTFRKNTVNGNQSVSITSATSGYFEDVSNTDICSSTDEINYQIVTATSGVSMSLNTVGFLATYPSGHQMALLGCGA